MADHPVLQEAYADAQKAHDDAELVKVGADGRAAGGGWGSWLSSFVKTTAARSLPTRTEYENAIVQRLKPLSLATLLSIGSPTEVEKKFAFAAALGSVARTKLAAGALNDDECEELYDRVAACKAALAATGKTSEVLVDHARWVLAWMQWRFDRSHLMDAVLFHTIEAEAQLVEAKTPGLLIRPSDALVAEANALGETARTLKFNVLKRAEAEALFLTEQISANAAAIAALRARDDELERRVQEAEAKK